MNKTLKHMMYVATVIAIAFVFSMAMTVVIGALEHYEHGPADIVISSHGVSTEHLTDPMNERETHNTSKD